MPKAALNMKKNKFEKIEKDNRRRSELEGPLMKSSWTKESVSDGRPSVGVYERSFVSDVAPKRSFEELP